MNREVSCSLNFERFTLEFFLYSYIQYHLINIYEKVFCGTKKNLPPQNLDTKHDEINPIILQSSINTKLNRLLSLIHL